jgi:hypothetical protein
MVGHERPLLPPRELVGRSAPAEKRKGACWGWVEEGVWVLTKASNQAENGGHGGRQCCAGAGKLSRPAARHVALRQAPMRCPMARRRGVRRGLAAALARGIEERRLEMVRIEDRECSARLGAMRKKGGESN